MTTIALVRHATCDPVGHRLVGRIPGISLNAEGRAQAGHLAERFAGHEIAAVYTSPVDRARETANAISARVNVEPLELSGLNEIDFGRWTGRSFEELQPLPEWQRFNQQRSTVRIPGGELMLEAQVRGVATMEDLRSRHPDETVIAVSHADMIKAILAHYAGTSIDYLPRIEIAPASVSILSLEHWGDRIVRLNDTGALF